MKKFYLKFLVTACMTLAMTGAVHAEVLQPADALSRALSQATTPAKAPSRSAAANMQLSGTFKANDGLPAAYMFTSSETDTTGNPSAFVLVAADDIVPSMLLGYSDSAPAINGLNSLPPALHRLILDYAAEIEFLRATEAQSAPASRAEADTREPILPMVTTHWNQDMPYNSKCPIVDETYQCVTGCVATAMAQVMNYHKWPKTAHGSNSYTIDIYNPYTDNTTEGMTISMDFEGLAFDWDNMLDDYTYTPLPEGGYETNFTQVQSDAVSTLMKACGTAINIGYGPYETYGYDINVLHALLTYFDYDKSVHIIQRLYTPIDDWEQQIYDNLTEYGPVYMSGQSTGGHAFVIDGYSSDRFFHVNWGWGGVSDGYFRLTAMDPAQQGIGAATTTGYNYYQWAMLGIRPNTGNQTYPPARLCTYAGFSVHNTTIENNVLTFNSSIDNIKHYPASGQLGMLLRPNGESNALIIDGEGFSLQPNESLSKATFQLPAMDKEGLYIAYLLNSDAAYGDTYRYVQTHVAFLPAIALAYQDNEWSVYTDFALSINDIDFSLNNENSDNVHFSGIPSTISVTVKNNAQFGNELHDYMEFLVIDKDNTQVVGSFGNPVITALNPEEQNTYNLTGLFHDNNSGYLPAGEYILGAYHYNVKGIQGLARLSIEDTEAETPEISVDYIGPETPSEPVDLNNLRLRCDLSCAKGAIWYNAVGFEFHLDSEFMGRIFTGSHFLKRGQSTSFHTGVQVTIPEEATLRVYPIVYRRGATDYEKLDETKYWEYTLPSSGIESTTGDQAPAISFTYDASAAVLNVASMACIRSIEVFNTSGSMVLSENHSDDMLLQATISLDAMPRGAYIVKATDNDGNSATHKLLR